VGVSKATEETWYEWADMFATRGYTTVEVDVSVASAPASAADTANGSSDDSSNGNGAPSFPREIAAAKSALNDQIRLLNIPFAPIIVASGSSCLVAQAYISDHAASGLVLVSPPPDADPRTEATTQEAGWAYPQFTYEPRFPILLVAEPGQEEAVTASRVGSAAEDGVGRGGKGVSIQVATEGPRGEKTRMVSSRASGTWRGTVHRHHPDREAPWGSVRLTVTRRWSAGWTAAVSNGTGKGYHHHDKHHNHCRHARYTLH
jgi:hypothetical protein